MRLFGRFSNTVIRRFGFLAHDKKLYCATAFFNSVHRAFKQIFWFLVTDGCCNRMKGSKSFGYKKIGKLAQYFAIYTANLRSLFYTIKW